MSITIIDALKSKALCTVNVITDNGGVLCTSEPVLSFLLLLVFNQPEKTCLLSTFRYDVIVYCESHWFMYVYGHVVDRATVQRGL